MKKNRKTLKKPDGEELPIDAEVGKFFSPDGSFDEIIFRRNLKDYLIELNEMFLGDKNSKRKISSWFSVYLSDILEYLNEKKMIDASYNLFKTAVDEYSRMGIGRVIISSEHLKNIFEIINKISNNGNKKKTSKTEMRKRIFNAAVQVFSEEGYYKATMDKIAAVSGVGKGSIYRYFNSKEELLSQLLTEKYEEIIKHFNHIFSNEPDVIVQIQKMIEFWVTFIEENHEVYRLIQSEAITQKSGHGKMFYDYIITHLPMLKERIVSLNMEKRIKTTSFYSVFYGILGFIDGVVYKWTRQERSYPLRDEIPIILEVLFNGFIGEQLTKKRYYLPPE